MESHVEYFMRALSRWQGQGERDLSSQDTVCHTGAEYSTTDYPTPPSYGMGQKATSGQIERAGIESGMPG